VWAGAFRQEIDRSRGPFVSLFPPESAEARIQMKLMSAIAVGTAAAAVVWADAAQPEQQAVTVCMDRGGSAVVFQAAGDSIPSLRTHRSAPQLAAKPTPLLFLWRQNRNQTVR
jgi:hypothetical protein